jgi:hypothetical protein
MILFYRICAYLYLSPSTLLLIETEVEDSINAIAAHEEIDSAFGTRPLFALTGIREILLSAYTDGNSTHQYRVIHCWDCTGNKCVSRFDVSEPPVMVGTSLFLGESRDSTELSIHLRLSTANRALQVHPSRSTQKILGTDFTYEELRLYFPFNLYTVCNCMEDRVDRREVIVVTLRPKVGFEISGRIAVALDRASGLIVAKTYFDCADIAYSSYKATEWFQVGGYLVPRRMTVTAFNEPYWSDMKLRRLALGIELPDRIFDLSNATATLTGLFDELLSCPTAME